MSRYLLVQRSLTRVRHAWIPSTHHFPLVQVLSHPFVTWFAHEWHRENFMENETLQTKEAWFSDLIKHYPKEVDAEAYCVILQALARSGERGAPQEAENVLSHMVVTPNDRCYHFVVEAWAYNRWEEATICIPRAERWFTKVKEPNLETYHALLSILSKGKYKFTNRQRHNETSIRYAIRAENVLNSMVVEPDTHAYNYVIRAWLRVRFDAELRAAKVMEWLRRMEAIQQQNPGGRVQPNTKSYTMGMECHLSLVSHRIRTRTGDGLSELESISAILSYMHTLQNQGRSDVTPNTIAYNIIITVYARLAKSSIHHDAPIQAEKVLRHMIDTGNDIAPDHLSYNKVILAWSNSLQKVAPQRALYWLNKLWESYQTSGFSEKLRPRPDAYNLALSACRMDPIRAEEVFMELLRAEETVRDGSLGPNSESFSLLINMLAKTHLSRAVMWLEELLRRESQPDSTGTSRCVSVPALFDCLLKNASLEPTSEKLDLALKVLDLRRSSRHDTGIYSYVWLIKTGLAVLAEPHNDVNRERFIAKTIQDCRSEGVVTKAFIRAFTQAPVHSVGWTEQARQEIMEEYFSEWPIPVDWTRNVPLEFMPSQSDAMPGAQHHDT